MNLSTLLKDMETRLFLNTDKLSKLLNFKKQDLLNLINEKTEPSEEQVMTILKLLNIEKKFLEKHDHLEVISIKKPIDTSKYSSPFKAYTEILKYYFPKPCHTFVLTKIKHKNSLASFFDLFFHNNKRDIINQMESFTPSYLIKKDNHQLLVNITSNYLYISEVSLNENSNTFFHKDYKYKVANEIYLDKRS